MIKELDLSALLMVAAAGAIAYPCLVLMLRVTGKRALGKMNAFDLVITIALGSSLSTILLDDSVSVWKGMAGVAFLIAAQFIVAWLSVRFSMVRGLVKAEPRLLVHQGEYLTHQMKSERITEDDVLAALRSNGACNLKDVNAVVLERDGSLSVLLKAGDCLADVRRS